MKDRIVLISGGTSGIGLAAARIFLSRGMKVALAGRNESKGRAAIQTLDTRHSGEMFREKAKYFMTDVSQPEGCERLVQDTIARFGRIDVLVNSAGVYFEQAAEDLTEEDYARVMDVNLKGTMFLTKYALPYLKESRGNIVNVSSDAGLRGNFLCSLYCASKGAVTLYTKALAIELAPFGIRVNCVCPGDILTPMTEAQLQGASSREDALKAMESVYPMQRIGTAEEAAAVIAFLASSAASFVTGAAWSVDGGLGA